MKYTRALDYLLAAVTFQQAGRTERAAAMFEKAASHPSMPETATILERAQATAFAASKTTASTKKPSLAEHLAELAAAKKKKKAAKLPFKGAAKPFAKKKKAKADMDSDDFENTLDEMTEEDAEDLSLEDLEDTFGDEGVEEMPLASEEEDMDGEGVADDDIDGFDDEEVAADDSEDDEDSEEDEKSDEEDESEEDEEDEKEEDAKATAKANSKPSNVARVAANMQALSRLQTAVGRK